MIPFNGWNWYFDPYNRKFNDCYRFLAFTGQTTIEFWTKKSNRNNQDIEDDEVKILYYLNAY